MVRSKKLKLIHFKLKNMKLVPKFFKNFSLFVVALFESYLFKNKRHKCKQINTRNMKNYIGITDE